MYFLRLIYVDLKKFQVDKFYKFNVNPKCAVIRLENKFYMSSKYYGRITFY